MDDKNRRKTLIVNPTLQRRLIADVAKVPIIALIAGLVIVAFEFWLIIRLAEAADLELLGIYGLMASLIGLLFILTCFVILHTAIRISNRIIGPLYRLRLAMERVLKDDMDFELKIRKGDYLVEIVDIFNAMIAHIRDQQKAGSAPAANAPEETGDNEADECSDADERKLCKQP